MLQPAHCCFIIAGSAHRTWLSSQLYRLSGLCCSSDNTKKMKAVPLKGTHLRQAVACCTRQQCSKGERCKDAYILNTCTSIYIKGMLIISLVDPIWCSSLRHPGFTVMIFSSQPSSKRSKLKLLCCLSSLKLAKKLEW